MNRERLLQLNDAAASKAREAARVHSELGEVLAELGRELAKVDEELTKPAEEPVDATPPPIPEQPVASPKRRASSWSQAEEELVRLHYPDGARAALDALSQAGYYRTLAAITYRAFVLGVRVQTSRPDDEEPGALVAEPGPTTEAPVRTSTPVPAGDLTRAERRVLEAVRSFKGEAVSTFQIGAAAGLSERATDMWIPGLVRRSLVATLETEQGLVYYDPAAEDQEAA